MRNHWRGDQSLLWSFWVNLVGLRILILFVERFTHPPFSDQSTLAIMATVIYLVLFHVIVYVWQVRGLLKACDRFITRRGAHSTVVLTQIGIVASLFLTILIALGAFQSLFEDPEAMYKNRFKKGPALLGEYSLSLSGDNKRIHMSGDFNIGLTLDLAALLEKNPDVDAVTLSSTGGRITEGRGVAKLIKTYALDTYVVDSCMSACMTAYIGGVRRHLGPEGKLGFHQFALDSMLKTPYIDPKEEQRIDKEFYESQGVDKDFLERVFQASHTDIWFPSTPELLQAGVVHEILREQ